MQQGPSQQGQGESGELVSLRKRFAKVAGLSFDEANGLVRVHVATPSASATIYQQGAHLTAWQPAGADPVIFLSSKSDLSPGKPIRGGVPIVFPWFGGDWRPGVSREQRGPSHGFARIQPWSLASAEPVDGGMHLKFALGPTEMSRSMAFGQFQLSLEFTIGHELTMQMTMVNQDTQPVRFEEGFHTYFQVADIHEATVTGLESMPFQDRTHPDAKADPAKQPIVFTDTVDRVYSNTEVPGTIHDIAGRRSITVKKTNSKSTVVWNPWRELPDLGEWEWHSMLALETANVGENAITLAPGASWVMASHTTVIKGT